MIGVSKYNVALLCIKGRILDIASFGALGISLVYFARFVVSTHKTEDKINDFYIIIFQVACIFGFLPNRYNHCS